VTVTAVSQGGTTFGTAQTVRVAVGGGTATEGTDYAKVAAFDVTIPAGAASGSETFTLTPTNDILDEGDGETLLVSGAISGSAVRVDPPLSPSPTTTRRR